MSNGPGMSFGRYELLAELGRGGMAETWRARLVGAAGVTKPVLIKKVLPEFANDDAFISMFIREARISTTLSHGNIAQVFDFGQVDGQYFLAMELVDGQPLHRILKRALRTGLQSLPAPVAVFIALEMCRGLHYAHQRTDEKGAPLGIVHRDISPDNVLISYEGQVKIVDFGIAKARMQRTFDTEPGIVRGKYLYFSPEQARGKEVDARTDVWATGLVLYEMLCGQMPVAGGQATVMMRMAHGEFPSPRDVSRGVPPELNAIVMKALAVDVGERYDSAHAFGDALAGFLFSIDPRFSSLSLAHLLRELFREELNVDGRELSVPPSFKDELARWQKRASGAPSTEPPRRKTPPPRTPPPEPPPLDGDTLSLKPSRDPNMAPTVIVPGLSGYVASTELLPRVERRRPWLAVGGGVVLLVALVAVPWATGMFASETRTPPPEDVGPPAVTPQGTKEEGASRERSTASPGTDTPAPSFATAEFPAVSTFTLDATRDVILVPDSLTEVKDLDPAATYHLEEVTQREGAVSPTGVLEPSPRRLSPVFFLATGKKLQADARVGVVSRRRVSFQGATRLALFVVGAPIDEGQPERTFQLSRVGAGMVRRIVFKPDSRRVVPSQAFLLKGLDPRQTYGLSLSRTKQAAFLWGQELGEIARVVCAQDDREPAPARPEARDVPVYPERQVQFELASGQEVRVRGVSALRCGFIDDTPEGNSGAMTVRVTPRPESVSLGPRRGREAAPPPPPSEEQLREAGRLEMMARRLAKSAKPDESRDAFLLAEDCLSIVPNHAECLLLSAIMLARLGSNEEAIIRYRAFVRHHPNHEQTPPVKDLLKRYDEGHAGTR
ncbi:serine/threonine protein kinase [Myxococcus stipitatus]|uniref:serine/threonine protein kinase n=1 Tax=Myxococcus stipitatus TaxID=83455 RepID=UPI001F217999|nr:serine/threonine-protein kinase [Myxococcus stipitatus]MCE9671150.1 serine/threonine protein kinase [Myxococcus stipitatus]